MPTLIIGAAWYPDPRIHGLITIILIPGMAGDIIPVFTSGTPDSMGRDTMAGSVEASADRAELLTYAKAARIRSDELRGHVEERHAPMRP